MSRDSKSVFPSFRKRRTAPILLAVFCLITCAGIVYANALSADSAPTPREEAEIPAFVPQDLTDRVAFIDGSREDPNTYCLEDGTTVILKHAGLELTVFSENETVAQLINRLCITVDDDKAVCYDPRGEVPVISFESDFSYEFETRETTGFETYYEEDSSLSWRSEKVRQEGHKGYIPHRYLARYENGRRVENTLLCSGKDNAEDRIIAYGTKTRRGNVDVLDYFGGTVKIGGKSVHYSKKICMNGTAYTAGIGKVDTITATGTRCHEGIVAVDPKVIPLGSKLYIVGAKGSYVYGTAVAEDTGVLGNTIDLYMDTYNDCIRFGRRPVIVYILG